MDASGHIVLLQQHGNIWPSSGKAGILLSVLSQNMDDYKTGDFLVWSEHVKVVNFHKFHSVFEIFFHGGCDFVVTCIAIQAQLS